jgi:outer membrane protein TolC
MSTHLPLWRRAVLVGTLALPTSLLQGSSIRAQEIDLLNPPVGGQVVVAQPEAAPPVVAQPEALPVAPKAEATKLDLPTCRRTALERQPSLAAARATLAAAQERQQAVDSLRLAGLVRHDLDIRRQQAALGVQIAQAQLTQAEWETIYAVTRTYVGVLYAQTQLRVADRVLSDSPDGLPFLRNLAETIYKSRSRPDVKVWNVDQIEVYISVARGRREEAVEGLERAKAGLREAMGVDPDFPIDLADQRMPRLSAQVEAGPVISMALERRGEMAQAALLSDVVCLEVKAQGTSFHPKMETFASNSDIHSQPIPQAVRDGEYRPGAISVEMPVELVGSKSLRVERAQSLHARAIAVVDKTRGLISLEAKSAVLKFHETNNQVKNYSEARDKARGVYDSLRGGVFDPKDKTGGKPGLEDLLNTAVQSSQTEVQANQAQYLHLLSMAALERITAGGINPGFGTLSPTPAENGGSEKR